MHSLLQAADPASPWPGRSWFEKFPRRLTRVRDAAIAAFGMLALVTGGAGSAAAAGEICGTQTWDLTAGQTNDVGTLIVENDSDNIYVTFKLDDPDYPDATFGTLHLWIGTDLALVPAVKNGPNAGTPIPGQFPYQYDATGETEYKFTIKWSDVKIPDITKVCGLKVYIVAHAEVYINEGDEKAETAFGGDQGHDIKEPGRWWFHAEYKICCPDEPPVLTVCETAFAKGGYVFTTDSKSNPEKLPSLNLTKNRWGWAIEISDPGTYTYPIYAGAGLNKVSNGVLVGKLKVKWDGALVEVKYIITDAEYLISELHIYAGNGPPKTVAPGQYGFTQYFDPGVDTYDAEFSINKTDEKSLWIIAHAVVCKEDEAVAAKARR